VSYPAPPVEATDDKGIRDRISSGGEEAIGNLAQALLENPLFNSALATALGAGEKAVQAQRSAMGALNLPAATDVERLERRVRSVSERVEAIEDRIDEMARDLAQLRKQQNDLAAVSSDQSRLDVEEGSAAG
jgi:TolA-binding protein